MFIYLKVRVTDTERHGKAVFRLLTVLAKANGLGLGLGLHPGHPEGGGTHALTQGCLSQAVGMEPDRKRESWDTIHVPWGAGTCGGGFTHYATMTAPCTHCSGNDFTGNMLNYQKNIASNQITFKLIK